MRSGNATGRVSFKANAKGKLEIVQAHIMLKLAVHNSGDDDTMSSVPTFNGGFLMIFIKFYDQHCQPPSSPSNPPYSLPLAASQLPLLAVFLYKTLSVACYLAFCNCTRRAR